MPRRLPTARVKLPVLTRALGRYALFADCGFACCGFADKRSVFINSYDNGMRVNQWAHRETWDPATRTIEVRHNPDIRYDP